MLARTGILLVGHNLDGPRWQWKQEPGSVFINKRNCCKKSVSGYELGACKKQRILKWISKYGSVTFNCYGREFPDGGMNEAGLVINEMGFGYQDYSYNDSLPTMMATQWIQYQLDNYKTVREVIENINAINIVSWGLPAPFGGNNWHYFISDKNADFAIIEFQDGKAEIFTGKSAKVPVLCNNAYQQDAENLKKYRGFGGTRPIILQPKLFSYWFNQGARMVLMYNPDKHGHPVKYCFRILRTMQRPFCEQWSIVYDIKHSRIGFRTFSSPKLKYLDLSDFNFTNREVKVIPDIHSIISGNAASECIPYTHSINSEIVEKSLYGFLNAYERSFSFKQGQTEETYVERRKKIVLEITGTE